jgi:hypothetical protein
LLLQLPLYLKAPRFPPTRLPAAEILAVVALGAFAAITLPLTAVVEGVVAWPAKARAVAVAA